MGKILFEISFETFVNFFQSFKNNKKIKDCRNISQVGIHNLEKWRSIRHSNIVRLHEVFSTKAFGDQSLVFVYDFHPCSDTLMDE